MIVIRLTLPAKLGRLFGELETCKEWNMRSEHALNLISLIIVLVLVIISGL